MNPMRGFGPFLALSSSAMLLSGPWDRLSRPVDADQPAPPTPTAGQVQPTAIRHPRTNRVWLRRLLGGPVRLQCSVRRGDALARLKGLGLVQFEPVKDDKGRVVGRRVSLTEAGRAVPA